MSKKMLKIASFNCNSINLRLPHIKTLFNDGVDVVCLQETKVRDSAFPLFEVETIGYNHVIFSGEATGQRGVAVLSKYPIKEVSRLNIVDSGKRHIAFEIEGITVHNFYIPAGGDLPDVSINQKFDEKLRFLDWTIDYFSKIKQKTIILGDFNIAPFEKDVHDHKRLLKVVSHSPIEIEIMAKWVQSGDFVDITREFIDKSLPCYTWWSYRIPDAYGKGYGRRLDHIWCTKDIWHCLKSVDILHHYRSTERPSDHVPVVCGFEF